MVSCVFFLLFYSFTFFSLNFVTKHPFHIVSLSPWPLFSAFSALILVSGIICLLNGLGSFLLFCGLSFLFLSCFFWFGSVVIESTFYGCHTRRVQSGLCIGILLFIVSELFFFLGFF